jgi:hypothetical protein
MIPMPEESKRGQSGFALILALLALMLLTFLGLTLAATTSTELQIATNERWAQQAYYNAEAGLEVGKKMLQGMNWSLILPPPRQQPSGEACTNDDGLRCWLRRTAGTNCAGCYRDPAPYSRPDIKGNPTRNYENGGCDDDGNGMGYGVVLDDGGGFGPYQNVTTVLGKSLNGTFTLWVRRETPFNKDAPGSMSDDIGAPDSKLILTAEGTAPFVEAANNAFATTNRAIRFMEARLATDVGTPCGTRGGQVGGGPEGSNFSPCDPVTGAGLTTGADTGAQ